MGTHAEDANPGHFPAVHRRLLRGLNPRIPEQVWRRLFEQPWARPGDCLGRVLLDGGEPVGYLAFVHGRLPRPDGAEMHVCNVSTWIVEPAYSSLAPSLILPALAIRDATVTNLTPIESAHGICTALGFRELETGVRVLYPVPLTRNAWRPSRTEHDARCIAERLPPWERRIAEDHGAFARHVLLEGAEGEHCYAIYRIGRRRGLRSARLHWVTPGALAFASVALRRVLLRRSGILLVEVDDRLAPPGLPGQRRFSLRVPRLFRPVGAAEPSDVSAAYSEMILLEL